MTSKYVSNTTRSRKEDRKNREIYAGCIPSEADKTQWSNDLRGYKYTDCRTIPSLFSFSLFFFRAGRAADTSLRRSQRNRVAPNGKTQYHPVMTAPYFSKVPLRG